MSAMDSEGFRSVSAFHLATWLGTKLGLKYNTAGGIDLCDDECGVEVKTRYDAWAPKFVIHSYQIDAFPRENEGKKLYWAFILYSLRRPPSEIDVDKVRKSITRREVWIAEWEWVRRFPVARCKTGPYVYIHKRNLPDGHCVGKRDKIHFPEDVFLEDRLGVSQTVRDPLPF